MCRRTPVLATVGLGANLGDAQVSVRWALAQLGSLATGAVSSSGLYGSAPVDASGPDFVNAVAQFSTELNAVELLHALQAIENRAGRERPYKNAPRTLDLDLLSYGDARIDSTKLVVPHPRMFARAFVVIPLAQLAPELVSADAIQAVSGQGIWPL